MKSRDQGLGIRGWGRKAGFWVLGAGYWGLLASLVMAVGSGIGLAKQATPEDATENLTIVLRVYDYAGVGPAEYARAQEEASRVLRRAGLVIVWVDCPVLGAMPQTSQVSRKTPGAPELVLRILPRSMAERAALDKGTLGFAQQSTDDTPAVVANVFYHRVEELADELACTRAVILGHALAHEIGHFLLGANRHSANGIMRAHWSEKELHGASAGSLVFLPQQAARMRADVQGRGKAQFLAGGHVGPALWVAWPEPAPALQTVRSE